MIVELWALGMTIAGAGLGGAVSWGATRNRLLTVEKKAEKLAADVRTHENDDVEQHTEIVQRLTKIETILERIEERVS